jgi:phospho-N-acetylmuramoyl-pentapeptide-transferase
MAPLHHHFERIGWSETQVTQRFTLIGAIAAIIGISMALTFAANGGTSDVPITNVLPGLLAGDF